MAGRVTLADLWADMGQWRVVDASLHNPRRPLKGMCDYQTGTIVVDLSHDGVDTLIHELVHLRHPRYGEKRVLKETARLMKQMDDAERAKWWARFKRHAKKTRPVKLDDEDGL